MTDRITIAKTEITMQDHACITPTTGFIVASFERGAEECDEREMGLNVC